jgi:hypothetical protein
MPAWSLEPVAPRVPLSTRGLNGILSRPGSRNSDAPA